jgi:hypothetical protein
MSRNEHSPFFGVRTMSKKHVSAAEVLTLARGLVWKVLKTLHRSARFTVEIKEDDELVFTPQKTGVPRKHFRKTLEMICDRFNRDNSLNPSDYDGTRNASYTLTLIDLCVNR